MPTEEKDKKVQFTNYKAKLKAPVVAYADFEAIQVESSRMMNRIIDGRKEEVEQIVNDHVVCAYGIQLVSDYPALIKQILENMKIKSSHMRVFDRMLIWLYRGRDSESTQKRFYEDIKSINWAVKDAVKMCIPLVMTPEEDNIAFDRATDCHICEKPLDKTKVKDHDHYSGRYRGAAHSKCNIIFNCKNIGCQCSSTT